VVALDLSLSKTPAHIDSVQALWSGFYIGWIRCIGIAKDIGLAFRGSQLAFALTGWRY